MDYKIKIDEILNQALTEKTFTLEIVEKIKSLRDGFEASQEQIANLKCRGEELQKQITEIRAQNSTLLLDVNNFKKRESELSKKEMEQEKLRYELEFQRRRADEIKALFECVFRNPVIVRNKITGHVYPQNGYYSITTTNDSEQETIE